MNAIALIIALLIERFGADLECYRSADRYLGLLRRLRDRVGRGGYWDGWFGVLLLLMPAALAMVVFERVFAQSGVLGSLLGMALSAWILFWCLRAWDARRDVEAFLLAYDTGDQDAAAGHLHTLYGQALPSDVRDWPGAALEAYVGDSAARLFTPVFWFVVLGPAGALLAYSLIVLDRRLASDEQGSEFARAVARAEHWVAWLPVRVMVMLLAVLGSFDGALRGWQCADTHCGARCADGNRAVLVCAARGALGLPLDRDALQSDPELRCATRHVRDGVALLERVMWIGLGCAVVWLWW